MFSRIRNYFQELHHDLQMEWEEFMWRNGPERHELARKRLAAHEKAMKEGRDSPYTHPEQYGPFIF